MDGVSLPLVFLNCFLSFLVVLISWKFELRPQLYFVLVQFLQTAVTGVFVSLDLFVFFLFWELELAPMFLLIGIWGGARREYAAMKFIIYTIAGSAFMLVGILALFFTTGVGTFDLFRISDGAKALPVATQVLMFLLLFVGFAVKVPIVPFHTWLPDAHVEAPTPISVLLAGILLKMGGYGLIRLCVTLLPDGARVLAPFLVILGVVGVIYGAMLALAQINGDLKKMIAYSSVSHMGYVILGLAALTHDRHPGRRDADVHPRHDHGAALHDGRPGLRPHPHPDHPGHGRAGPEDAVHRRGFVMAGLASLGLPGMNGFIGEFLVFIGAFEVWPVYTAIAAFAIVLTAGYICWMLMQVFFGRLDEHKWHGLTDADRAREAGGRLHARDHHPDRDVPERRRRHDRDRRRADRAAVRLMADSDGRRPATVQHVAERHHAPRRVPDPAGDRARLLGQLDPDDRPVPGAGASRRTG